MRLLLLASNFGAPYRALRCVAALGTEVYVVGSGPARSLALSRFCRRFEPFSFELKNVEDAACRLDAAARAVGADMVVPSDFETTRFLAQVRPYLLTPTFPLSAPETIEQLGTKDQFMELCRRMNVLHPSGIVLSSKYELEEAVAAERIPMPAILKPLDLAGGMGVVRIDQTNVAKVVSGIGYAPILAQQFIEGTDRCITLFCREGRVLKEVVYEHPGGVFRFLEDKSLSGVAGAIASALKLTGVINFDARIDAQGRVWMIECNPRFYFNMDVAMVAGLNFADWTTARSPASVTPQQIRIPKALLRALFRLRPPARRDLKMLWHWLKDPLMFGLVAIGFEERWQFRPLTTIATIRKAKA